MSNKQAWVASDMSAGAAYRLLTALVVPRPIAWVSTTSREGVDNIGAFSFSGVVASDPPIVQFSTIGWKDSSKNAHDTGRFLFHLAPANFLTSINQTGIDFPPGVDEFEQVGLTKEHLGSGGVPGIRESPAALECRVLSVQEIGNAVMVLGQVVCFWVDRDCLVDGMPDSVRMSPVGRLGGPEWMLPGEVHIQPRVQAMPE